MQINGACFDMNIKIGTAAPPNRISGVPGSQFANNGFTYLRRA